jgi:ribose transport system ATP-binding protein
LPKFLIALSFFAAPNYELEFLPHSPAPRVPQPHQSLRYPARRRFRIVQSPRRRIVALLGQNGAGKSTLIKILAGIYPATAGEIRFNGESLPKDHRALPVAFIHQDLGLIEWMTVAENLAIGTAFSRRCGLIDWKSVDRKAGEILQKVGGGIPPRARIFRLSRTERSLVAIARALAQNAKVLVLDEPTSSLTATDVDRLFLVLNDLRRSGVGMIYVSHRLDEIFRISDRVVIMRDGQVVGAKRTAETEPEELVELIVGHRLSDVYSRAKDLVAEPNRLSVEDLRTGHVSGVHFQVRRGEVLGLTGLKGAGQRESRTCPLRSRNLPSRSGEVGWRTHQFDYATRSNPEGYRFCLG